MVNNSKKSKRRGKDAAAARAARKQLVRKTIKDTTDKVKEHRNIAAIKKRRLEEISGQDIITPEDIAEIELLTAEVAKLDGDLMVWKKELENLEEEDKDLDGDTNMNGNENEEHGSLSNNTTGPPLFNHTPPPLDPTGPDDDKALFTPAQGMEAIG